MTKKQDRRKIATFSTAPKSLVINDLQYDEGKPYVVLGWLNTPKGRMPSFRVPLEPKYLLASKLKEFDYLYQIPVSFPF